MSAPEVPGLYSLVSLEGAPLPPADRESLGLSPSPRVQETQGFAVRGCDPLTNPSAISFHRTAESLLAFAGFLDEPEDLASRLGSADNAPPAHLAFLALGRFGSEAPRLMVGEWSLLCWSSRPRELTLLCSENLRDPLYWATNGALLAVSPDMLRLGRLPWVGLELDPHGFALSVSRAGVRHIRGQETIWRGIHAVRLQRCSA